MNRYILQWTDIFTDIYNTYNQEMGMENKTL